MRQRGYNSIRAGQSLHAPTYVARQSFELQITKGKFAALCCGAKPGCHRSCFGINLTHTRHLVGLFYIVQLVDTYRVDPERNWLICPPDCLESSEQIWLHMEWLAVQSDPPRLSRFLPCI